MNYERCCLMRGISLQVMFKVLKIWLLWILLDVFKSQPLNQQELIRLEFTCVKHNQYSSSCGSVDMTKSSDPIIFSQLS